jgi:hypothetical protein
MQPFVNRASGCDHFRMIDFGALAIALQGATF